MNIMYRGVLLRTVERHGDSIIIKDAKGKTISSEPIGKSLKH